MAVVVFIMKPFTKRRTVELATAVPLMAAVFGYKVVCVITGVAVCVNPRHIKEGADSHLPDSITENAKLELVKSLGPPVQAAPGPPLLEPLYSQMVPEGSVN